MTTVLKGRASRLLFFMMILYLAVAVHAVDDPATHACAAQVTRNSTHQGDIEKRVAKLEHALANCTLVSLPTSTLISDKSVSKDHRSTKKSVASKTKQHHAVKTSDQKTRHKALKAKHRGKSKKVTHRPTKTSSLQSAQHHHHHHHPSAAAHRKHAKQAKPEASSRHPTKTSHRKGKKEEHRKKKPHTKPKHSKLKHTPTSSKITGKKGYPVSTHEPKKTSTSTIPQATSTTTTITTTTTTIENPPPTSNEKYVAPQSTADDHKDTEEAEDANDAVFDPSASAAVGATAQPSNQDAISNPNDSPKDANSDVMYSEAVDAQRNNATIGVSIGAVAGCVAAAGLAGMFIQRRRQTRKEESNDDLENQQNDEVNTRWKHQSFMNAVAGAVAKLPKRSNSSASQNNGGGGGLRSLLGTIRRTASNASSKSRSSEQSYGIAVTTPMPPIEPVNGQQAAQPNYTHAY
ncbi:hypothetical protein EC973_003160 [Apophysomyces ossiformis]|uniref:Mid2 domain-containing protein n=1 Tax=Apophysomyces ossiformis TaxID=679940 RepID=A0A8H7BJQ5_9FUNG|nr:hypothetical protein EC973_003160 [Apophysomyces ossiformis]